jgi:catechol 2,3-dioxygenase-like lactoylglutathione lyase family enzyme
METAAVSWLHGAMSISVREVVPILRMFDVEATKRFYVDYLGCSLDWQDGEGDRPVYMQVSRGELVLHLSSNHDDGTPGGAVLIEMLGVDELHSELRRKGYPFLNPGIEPAPGGGREMQLIDPASNRLRFWERARPA